MTKPRTARVSRDSVITLEEALAAAQDRGLTPSFGATCRAANRFAYAGTVATAPPPSTQASSVTDIAPSPDAHARSSPGTVHLGAPRRSRR